MTREYQYNEDVIKYGMFYEKMSFHVIDGINKNL